jgi:hypothetical protein
VKVASEGPLSSLAHRITHMDLTACSGLELRLLAAALMRIVLADHCPATISYCLNSQVAALVLSNHSR